MSVSIASRRMKAVESFKSAAGCIGTIEKNMSIFAITRGQFSMIDAVLVCLDQAGPAHLTVWTWTIAEYEVECLDRLRLDNRILSGLLVIDKRAFVNNCKFINMWKSSFGEESVRYTMNHAKIATVQNDKFKILMRGSFNLNFNARFEQFDLTEGGPDFDLVNRLEKEFPFKPDAVSKEELYESGKFGESFDNAQLKMFRGVKVWAK